MEKIEYQNTIFAIVVRENFDRDGITFVTDGDALLEVGYMKHPAGHNIQPHRHLPFQRTTFGTQEVLYVKSGRVRVNFYAETNTHVGTTDLTKGDWIILLAGGHGFEVLESCVIVEVKNGPYARGGDKVKFTSTEQMREPK